MSDTIIRTTPDLLLPAPRRSPETTTSRGQEPVEQPDFGYPGIRYAMERLRAVGLL